VPITEKTDGMNKDAVKLTLHVSILVPILMVDSCQNLTCLLFVSFAQDKLLGSGIQCSK